MKYELDQIIFYIMNNVVHNAPVLSRICVENLHDDWISNKEQKEAFTPFGSSGIKYSTCHGVIEARHAFSSVDELLESLR